MSDTDMRETCWCYDCEAECELIEISEDVPLEHFGTPCKLATYDVATDCCNGSGFQELRVPSGVDDLTPETAALFISLQELFQEDGIGLIFGDLNGYEYSWDLEELKAQVEGLTLPHFSGQSISVGSVSLEEAERHSAERKLVRRYGYIVAAAAVSMVLATVVLL